MAATLHSPLPSNPSTPPTPSSAFPAALARLRETALERNASTSSSRSTQTNDSSISTTSSLEAVPIRPPPDKTRTAATPISQLASRPSSAAGARHAPAMSATASAQSDVHAQGQAHALGYGGKTAPAGPSAYAYGAPAADYHSPSAIYGGRNFQRNGPRMGGAGRHATAMLPAIVTSDAPIRSSSVPLPEHGYDGQSYGFGQNPPQLGLQLSPTTPRQSRFYDSAEADPGGSLRPIHRPPGSVGGSPNLRGSVPSSPIEMKTRGLKAGEKSRERRQSSHSARSTGSARPRESASDYVFGEELGRGSYSTVVQAVRALPPNQSPSSPRPPRQYAIKIINQAHLVAEKKTKYAMIERDALVRLNAPLSNTAVASPSNPAAAKGHRRGMSGSSNNGPGNASIGPRKNCSSASLNQSTQSAHVPSQHQYASQPSSRRDSTVDRLSIVTTLSDSTSSGGASGSMNGSANFGSSAPLSPTLPNSMAGRRPSRSADPPEMVPERSDEGHSEVLTRSRPPSPVREDSREHALDAARVTVTPPKSRTTAGAGTDGNGEGDGKGHDATYGPPETPVPPARQSAAEPPRTPRAGYEQAPNQTSQAERKAQSGTAAEKREARRSNEDREQLPRSRRASKAPSDRSSRSVGARCHPGVIRLFSTFNDATSLYFVLDLAANGELLGQLRKYGSLDTVSARYYAAQLLDVVDFMHERGVIHRDLKPENILLDDDMRIKVTDFGSAKLLDADLGPEEGKKRSFVGSADFVSPEVLRNESASAASDVWAFGCIVYQLFVGKPPFRGATDYLTFQKILKREMVYPDGFPEEARELIDSILNLDTASRPTASDLRSHPFFSSIDFSTIWTTSAPPMSTGITKPVITLANIDPQSDMWAVFDDDVSDGGFGDDADLENAGMPHDSALVPPHAQMRDQAQSNGHVRQISSEDPHRWSPQYDHLAAADAVRSVDLTDPTMPRSPHASAASAGADGSRNAEDDSELDPPRPGWMDSVRNRKKRGFSRGSARTSSSSSANRTALTGLLESMGIHTIGQPGSGRTSRNSMKSDDTRPAVSAPAGVGAGGAGAGGMASTSASPQKGRKRGSRSGSASAVGASMAQERMGLRLSQMHGAGGQDGPWSSLLISGERIIFTSAVTIRTSALPSFLTPNATKRRQLILTDFPRLFAVKDESSATGASNSSNQSNRDKDTSAHASTSANTGNSIISTHGSEGLADSAGQGSSLAVKNECILVPRPSAASALSTASSAGAAQAIELHPGAAGAGQAGAGGVNRLLDVQEKGPKGFLVNTSITYYADTTDLRNEWIRVIRQFAE